MGMDRPRFRAAFFHPRFWLLWLGLAVLWLVVLVVIAGVKANDGVAYRYPFTWRPLK